MNEEPKEEKPERPQNKNLLPPYKPGQSGNPAGIPKGYKRFSTILKERIAEGKDLEDVADVLIKKAKKGDTQCIALLYDRLYGKAPQSIDVKAQPAEPAIDLTKLSEAELLQLRALTAKANASD